MSKLKVIVTRAWPAEVEATLKEKYDVQLNETDVAMTKDEMKAALGNCDAFLPTVTDPVDAEVLSCLLYTSPSPRDRTRSRMPSSA